MLRITAAYAVSVIAAISIPIFGSALAAGKAAARDAYCADRKTVAERQICLSRDLTRKDAMLNEVYGALRAKLDVRAAKDLRDEQRKWLKIRNRCGSDHGCLATHYDDRIAVIEQDLENIAFPNKSHVEIGAGGGPTNEMTWTTAAYNDPSNKGKRTARLVHGVPETDDVQFAATCSAGSSGTFATAVFGYDISGQKAGRQVAMAFSTGALNTTRTGEIYGLNLEEGVSGILVHIDITDPLWEALASGNQAIYGLQKGEKVRLELNGSGVAVRNFVAECQAMFAGSRPAGQTASGPSCEEFGALKSVDSSTPVTVTFVNRTDAHRAIQWLNFEGTPVDYAALNAGESYTVTTYLTHPWMFTDGPGNCLEIYMPKAGDKRFEITAPNRFFGPEND